jgi:hypothetical protein
MNGECYEHNIRWYEGDTDCPLCKLESLFSADEQTFYKGHIVRKIIIKIIADWQGKESEKE